MGLGVFGMFLSYILQCASDFLDCCGWLPCSVAVHGYVAHSVRHFVTDAANISGVLAMAVALVMNHLTQSCRKTLAFKGQHTCAGCKHVDPPLAFCSRTGYLALPGRQLTIKFVHAAACSTRLRNHCPVTEWTLADTAHW
jgi:hypothetical protein